MNVAMMLFGIALVKLPGRNFARFLFILFAFYCLIIRTAWQSKMYEFMQKDMRKNEIKSIQELLDKKYDLHMSPHYKDAFKDISIVKR